MAEKYKQAIVMSSIPVKGWYRYQDQFQICPPPPETPLPTAILNDQPFVIQWKYTQSTEVRVDIAGNETPSWVINQEVAFDALKEIVFALGVFLNHRVFLYGNNQSWFITLGHEENSENRFKAQWGQVGYRCDGFNVDIDELSAPQGGIVRVDPNVYFNKYGRHFDDVLKIPNNLDMLFDIFMSLSDEKKSAFLSSCALYSQGASLWGESPSLSFTALVSCLETLIHFDNRDEPLEKCKECGQDRYRVVKKFRDFFTSYGSQSPEFKKYAVKVYKYRSKIVHRGELFLGEVKSRKFGMWEDHDDTELRRSLLRTCRICLVNWLIQNA